MNATQALTDAAKRRIAELETSLDRANNKIESMEASLSGERHVANDRIRAANDLAYSFKRRAEADDERITLLKLDSLTLTRQVEDLKRVDNVAASAHKGVLALFRCQIASLNLSVARAARQAADNSSDYWKIRCDISSWESRTGKDHKAVLAGDYAQPFGTEGPGR